MSILYVPRRLEQDIAHFVASEVSLHKPVLLLDGARQVGKTTLVDAVLDKSAKDGVRINLERDGFEITNLPAYLLERLGSSGSA